MQDDEMQVDEAWEDRKERIRMLIEGGKLREAQNEIFSPSALDMLDSGRFILDSFVFPPQYFTSKVRLGKNRSQIGRYAQRLAGGRSLCWLRGKTLISQR